MTATKLKEATVTPIKREVKKDLKQLLTELQSFKEGELTGRYYHKKTFFGYLLYVEYKYTLMDSNPIMPTTRWRPAEEEDLLKLKFI